MQTEANMSFVDVSIHPRICDVSKHLVKKAIKLNEKTMKHQKSIQWMYNVNKQVQTEANMSFVDVSIHPRICDVSKHLVKTAIKLNEKTIKQQKSIEWMYNVKQVQTEENMSFVDVSIYPGICDVSKHLVKTAIKLNEKTMKHQKSIEWMYNVNKQVQTEENMSFVDVTIHPRMYDVSKHLRKTSTNLIETPLSKKYQFNECEESTSKCRQKKTMSFVDMTFIPESVMFENI